MARAITAQRYRRLSWRLSLSNGAYRRPITRSRAPARLLGLSGVTATLCVMGFGVVSWARDATFSPRVFASMWDNLRTQVFMPWFGAVIVVLWILQWRFPARSQEQLMSKGLVQDLAWFVLSPVFAITVVSAYLDVLARGVATVLNGLSVNLVPALGVWKVAVLAFVIADLLAWCTHWLHHRLPTLW